MKRLNTCPFAITSGGKVLVNAAEFDGVHSLQRALAVARRHGAMIFIGIELNSGETRVALQQLSHGYVEAAARTVGRRQRLRREGKRPT